MVAVSDAADCDSLMSAEIETCMQHLELMSIGIWTLRLQCAALSDRTEAGYGL